MPCPLSVVDAFTDRPFAGNPAAVCVLDSSRTDAWMQLVASEMNLAETAFVAARDDGDFGLRWFTPRAEVDLCGHATLASAHVLWTDGIVPVTDAIRFHTRSGVLGAAPRGGLIEMDFPAEPAEALSPDAPRALVEGLGVRLLWAGRNRMDYVAEVESEAVLRALEPDMSALTRLDGRGVIVTCRSERSEFDFVSRFFAPRYGVPEDPVTGSAHCCLGPLWGERLAKTQLVGYQASPRGGVVHVTLTGTRVLLRGGAVTIHRGTLLQ